MPAVDGTHSFWQRLDSFDSLKGKSLAHSSTIKRQCAPSSYRTCPKRKLCKVFPRKPFPTPPEETAANQNINVASTPNQLLQPPAAKITTDEQVKEFRRNLGYFTGTEQWTRYACLCPHIVLLTDGALYIAEHGGEDDNTAYWLIDAIASYQGEADLKHHVFQVWKLSVLPPDPEIPPMSVAAVLRSKQPTAQDRNHHRHAVLTCTNGDEKQLVRQEIDLTDFLPIGDVTIYASVEKHPDISNDRQVMILLLPSEY